MHTGHSYADPPPEKQDRDCAGKDDTKRNRSATTVNCTLGLRIALLRLAATTNGCSIGNFTHTKRTLLHIDFPLSLITRQSRPQRCCLVQDQSYPLGLTNEMRGARRSCARPSRLCGWTAHAQTLDALACDNDFSHRGHRRKNRASAMYHSGPSTSVQIASSHKPGRVPQWWRRRRTAWVMTAATNTPTATAVSTQRPTLAKATAAT